MKSSYFWVGISLLVLNACTPPPSSNNGQSQTPTNPSPSNTGGNAQNNAAIPLQFSFFLEASGSMFGYGSPTSEFREALYDLMARIPDSENSNHTLNFVTDKAYPFGGTLDNFIANTDPYAPVKSNKKIPTGSSEFNEILKTAVAEAEKGKVGVLVSDCVYSLKSGSAADQLVALKPLITNIFKPKANDLEVLFLQLESEYKGTYYDYNNSKLPFVGKRPYYTIIIAKKAQMSALLHHQNYTAWQTYNTLKGYKNSAHFTATNANTSTYFSVLPLTQKSGTWAFAPTDPNCIKGITGCNLMGGKKLQFALVVDMSNVYADESYKTMPSNFSIQGTDIFTIKKIEKINATNIQNNDKHYTQSGTHIITVEAAKLTVASQDVKIQLNALLPEWVAESSNTDDRATHKDKLAASQTFGLEPLMQGIYAAYHSSGSTPAFFTTNVNVKK